MTTAAPTTERSTPATIAWLKADRDAHRTVWFEQCLNRAHTARALPAVFPSALAAQHATPMSDRVFDQAHFEKGMVIYLDNPHDSNPFGHIVTMIGHDSSGAIIVDTNDALIHGGGSVVRLGWFPLHWGVPVQFAAKSLNGFALDLGGASHPHPKPHPKPTLDNLHYAEHRLDKAIAYWQGDHNGHHPGLVKALQKDKSEIQQTIEKFGRAG